MRVFFICLSIFIVLIVPFCSCDLIASVCKHTPNYHLCFSTLQSDPRSHTASDVTGLSLIMVDAVKAKVSSALRSIYKLEKNNNHHHEKVAFSDCRERYGVVQKYDVGVAVEALTKGDQKFAVDGMNDAAIEAQICESNFKSSRSPITEVNKSVQDISLVASAIIKLLL